MCGIIGIVGKSEPAAPRLLEGLKRLEYRGYDSSGIACLDERGNIARRRAEGRIGNLEQLLIGQPLAGIDGIGHTRWATHGLPNEANAHPHRTDKLALVHNGIFENYLDLKQELGARAELLTSETDSEVAAHFISQYLDQGLSPEQAVAQALPRFIGAFALAILFVGEPGLMIVARRGSPLAIGYGQGEMFAGSDAMALAPFTNRITYLEEGDWAIITQTNAAIRTTQGETVNRPIHISQISGDLSDKGEYSHFMLKEIHEQPRVIGDTLHALASPAQLKIQIDDFPFDPQALERIIASACGTAFLAAQTARYWFETIAGVTMECDLASELRYRPSPKATNQAGLFISQSGETMDTLEALRHLKAAGLPILSVVNVPESTIARESGRSLLMQAGPEIGVASTKAFTAQLTVLALMAIALGRKRNRLSEERERALLQELIMLPGLMSAALGQADQCRLIAEKIVGARAVFYLGRGLLYPIALEGALKLKEISYIHAEGYAAGEMKHGPIALVDHELPVVMLATAGPLLEKTAANAKEITARRGRLILIADATAARMISRQCQIEAQFIVPSPPTSPSAPSLPSEFSPILFALPLQLIAYYTALLRGNDIDKPRNLAKSVTVE